MRHISFIVIFFLSTNQLFAQQGVDTIFAIKSGDSVTVYNNNIYSNCGSKFIATFSLSGDSIAILEKDTSHNPLRCMCYFDAYVSVFGLTDGVYRVFIFRQPMNLDSIYYIGSTQFTISNHMLPYYAFNTYFSDCQLSNILSENNHGTPVSFSLIGNYPNPFNPWTIIRYQVHRQGRVRLDIFDELGRFIVTLVDQEKPMGDYEIPWNASHFSGGIYLCRLTVGNETRSHKMTLLK